MTPVPSPGWVPNRIAGPARHTRPALPTHPSREQPAGYGTSHGTLTASHTTHHGGRPVAVPGRCTTGPEEAA